MTLTVFKKHYFSCKSMSYLSFQNHKLKQILGCWELVITWLFIVLNYIHFRQSFFFHFQLFLRPCRARVLYKSIYLSVSDHFNIRSFAMFLVFAGLHRFRASRYHRQLHQYQRPPLHSAQHYLLHFPLLIFQWLFREDSLFLNFPLRYQ